MTGGKIRRRAWAPALGLLALVTHVLTARADLADRYRRLFQEAQQAWDSQPTNAEAAWKYSRACFDRYDFASNDTQRAEFARLGIAAARSAATLRPDLAACHYYLGLNLGRLADATRNLGGLRLVSEMEQAFKRAAQIDALFDYAGPDRCLGLLYRDAPGWPISVGSRSKARLHLERARELAGNYPENQLNALEAWLKWGEKARAAAEIQKVEKILAEARTSLTGEDWVSSWSDWDRVWNRIKKAVSTWEASRRSR
jgi:hypothetical protein